MYNPIIITFILDLSDKHIIEIKNPLDKILRNLQLDDLYYDGEFVQGTKASKKFLTSKIMSFNLSRSIAITTRNLQTKSNYKKCVVVVTDFFKDFNFFKDEDVDFCFLKMGKHSEEFEKMVCGNHSFYFNSLQPFLDKIKKLIEE
jgi:hypothetical protein